MTKEEVIKRLKEARNTMQPFQYVNEAIDYAVQALEQTRWIPVSERLPEEAKRYLVYTRYDEVMTDYFYSDDHNSEFLQGEDIIAWMPLPESYKPESEE